MSKINLKLLFLLSFAFPLSVWAAGLVPCGGEGEPACELCHLFVMFEGGIRFLLLDIVPPIAVLMLVLGGILFFFAGESPAGMERAKSIIRATLIGLLLLFGAWLITNTFFAFIGVADWTGLKEGWFRVECPAGGFSSFFFPPERAFSISPGEELAIDFGLNPSEPLSQAAMTFDFDPNLLKLTRVIPQAANSNFKTFLPITSAGDFDAEKVISSANASGKIELGATTFDLDSGQFLAPQASRIDSLVTLVFEARDQQGTTEITIDSANSQLIASAGGIVNLLGAQEGRVEVTIE